MSIDDFAADRRLTVLLTGGRAPVTLELARAFHAAGHRVLVAESARYHLCRVSRAVERSFRVPSPSEHTSAFLAALEAIVASERVDALIPTCEEIFYVARGLERLRPHCRVWASPLGQLEELHNKWRFVQLAERLGLPTPPTRLIETEAQWLEYAAGERLDEGVVLKPAYSRFASRVLFLTKGESAAARRRKLAKETAAVSARSPWVAQRYVEGRQVCTYSVALEGELIAHAAYPSAYRLGPGAAVYFRPIEHEPARDWVRRLVRAIGFTGQIAFDFIEEADGELYAIECNPRATSGVHLFGADGGLAPAFLRPQALRRAGVVLTPRPTHSAMLAPAMLAAGLGGGVRSLGELRGWLRAFRAARDVVFSRKDLPPSFEQARVLWEAWRTSRVRGVKLAQATTIDIEWNGE